jgi:hypothetical protein
VTAVPVVRPSLVGLGRLQEQVPAAVLHRQVAVVVV